MAGSSKSPRSIIRAESRGVDASSRRRRISVELVPTAVKQRCRRRRAAARYALPYRRTNLLSRMYLNFYFYFFHDEISFQTDMSAVHWDRARWNRKCVWNLQCKVFRKSFNIAGIFMNEKWKALCEILFMKIVLLISYRTCMFTCMAVYKSKTIEYFCNYCLALVTSWKFISCIGLLSQYEKYYCLVLKFLIIFELRRRATVSEPII